MLIALQLVRTPQGPVDDEPARHFEDEQVTIGRAPNCHVVLPDSLRIISRQHARVNLRPGEVLLTCLSASAPVRVNDVNVPHGGVLPLRSGDVIHIGGFDLCLTTPAAPPAAALPARVPAERPVALIAALAAAPPAVADPAQLPVAQRVPEPDPAPVPVPVPVPVTAPAQRGRARLDEWFDLEPAGAAAPAVPTSSPTLATLADVDLDLRPGAPALPSPAPAPAPALPVPVPVPGAAAVAVAVVTAPAQAGPPKVAAPAAAPALALVATLPTLDDEDRAALMQAFMEGAGLGPRAGSTSTQLLTPMALTPAWMRHIGELLRASVEGSLALLHSRSTVKREMRAEVTVIARRQNNPLKFAPDALAALAHLVAAKRSPGFLEPVAALRDAHEDLLVHHLAVVAGMRAAMFELIARLGPDDVVHEEGPPKGLAMTLPTLHEAALWRRYRQRHAEMIARLDDDFDTVFGREFTKAYEAQARRVREKAPPEDTGTGSGGPTG